MDTKGDLCSQDTKGDLCSQSDADPIGKKRHQGFARYPEDRAKTAMQGLWKFRIEEFPPGSRLHG
jgi:hypothetical protein